MSVDIAVEVTLANPLSALDAVDLGLPDEPVNVGSTVLVSLGGALRLITAGMTTINPSDSAAIDALFNAPVLTQGARAATDSLYVGNAAPTAHEAPYMWVQTGLGETGQGCTIWIEDGL